MQRARGRGVEVSGGGMAGHRDIANRSAVQLQRKQLDYHCQPKSMLLKIERFYIKHSHGDLIYSVCASQCRPKENHLN